SASHSGAQSEPGEAKIFSTPILRSVRSSACAPLRVPGPSMPGMFSRTGKDERLDHHRNRARRRDQRADVHEVELLQRDAVDRLRRVRPLELPAAMATDQAADVAFADEDERQAPVEKGREPRSDAAAEGVEPSERCGFAPAVAQRRGLLGGLEVEALEGVAD